MIVAVDTSVIVPAHTSWDRRHDAAVGAINRFADEKTLIVPSHALMESYSVLTRLPRPFRTAPAEALRAPETFANRGISGGRIYDAEIAHTAREAGAEAILTFNAQHFWDEGLKVLTP